MANPVRIVPPVFPLDTLAPWQRAMVEQTAMSTQTDPVMAAVVSLGVLSATVAKKVKILMRSDAAAPLHLWVNVVAGPGEGKTRVFNAIAAPLRKLQNHLGTASKGENDAPVYRRSVHEHRMQNWMDQGDAAERVVGPSIEEVARLVRLRQLHAGFDARPRIIHSDITPTRLFDLLGRQASPIALVSPEAGFEEWFVGTRVAAQERSSFNRIWDGDTFERGRKDREVVLKDPALALIIGMQPEPARALARNQRFRGTGFTLRTLWCVPESRRGFTEAPFKPPVRAVVEQYQALVWEMIALGGVEAIEAPRIIQVSRQAGGLYDEFFNASQVRIRPGGDLEAIADYVERLRTNIPRIAGVLHIANGLAIHGAESVLNSEVGEDAMTAAIRIADTLLAHGQTVFGGWTRRSPVDALAVLVPEDGWHGRASDLYTVLSRNVPADSRTDDWPGAANALSRYLGSREEDLAARGLVLSLRRNERGSNVTLRWRSSSSPSSSAAAPEEARLEPDGADDDDDRRPVVDGSDD